MNNPDPAFEGLVKAIVRTTLKEYKRCNPCKLRGAKGKPAPKVDIKPRIPRACSEDSCESIARSRGMCGMHYTRWYRINNPTPGPASITLTIKEIHNEHRPTRV